MLRRWARTSRRGQAVLNAPLTLRLFASLSLRPFAPPSAHWPTISRRSRVAYCISLLYLAPTLKRIYPLFAILAVALLIANFVAGLWIGDFNAVAARKRETLHELAKVQRRIHADPAIVESAEAEARAADEQLTAPRQRMTIHMLLGSTATLIVVLVNSVAITYFIGTSRWCREVVDAYGLPMAHAEQMAVLKRRTFRWALLGIGVMLLVIGLGAAADPSGSNYKNSAALVTPHYVAAMTSIVVVAFAFWMQWQVIQENFAVLDRVMSGVREARAARGLPTEASSAS